MPRAATSPSDLGSETANEAARETLLETELHGKTFSLSPGDGVFRLDVYPYYYKSTQAPTGNELPAKVSGGLPRVWNTNPEAGSR